MSTTSHFLILTYHDVLCRLSLCVHLLPNLVFFIFSAMSTIPHILISSLHVLQFFYSMSDSFSLVLFRIHIFSSFFLIFSAMSTFPYHLISSFVSSLHAHHHTSYNFSIYVSNQLFPCLLNTCSHYLILIPSFFLQCLPVHNL